MEYGVDNFNVRHGLQNVFNACFINAPLSVLICVLYIRDWALKGTHTELCKTRICVASAFSDFVVDMLSGSVGITSNHFFLKHRRLIQKEFGDLGQHDAAEFLIFLLNRVENDASAGPAPDIVPDE